MKLLIQEHKKEIENLDKELESLWQGVSEIHSVEIFQEREKELQEYLERINRNIITKKEKKIRIAKPSETKKRIGGICINHAEPKNRKTRSKLLFPKMI